MAYNSRTSVTDSIDLGVALKSGAISVYFAQDGERLDITTNEGRWTRYEKGQALTALETYGAVANLNFTVVSDATLATFKLTKAASEHGSLGFMNPPDPAFGDTQGIAWFNTAHSWGGPRRGLLDAGRWQRTRPDASGWHGVGARSGHLYGDDVQ